MARDTASVATNRKRVSVDFMNKQGVNLLIVYFYFYIYYELFLKTSRLI